MLLRHMLSIIDVSEVRLSFHPFASMGRRSRSCSPSSRQRMATQRWLAKPGVRDSQNAKACVRTARNRANLKKKGIQSHVDSPFDDEGMAAIGSPPSDGEDIVAIGSPPSHNGYGQFNHDDSVLSMDNDPSDSHDQFDHDDSILSMDNDLPCSCDVPTLQALEILVGQWQKDWGSESTMWNEVFDTELACSRAKGEWATTLFFDQVAQRAMDGRMLLESIRDVVHTHCSYCRERLKYDAILLYDLLVLVLSEVKFFEVKLDTVHH
ncbi:uncharacterized protein F5891DRAFT_1201574 [Suillus fuscotomentosus]|uniref:Uncharacterized protein n=1 Tax=Suillus fuscotomentosus TaxID=1912939 RepID=A0AAD4DN82_9AGAM|nr:uncharacterized protein F5891DRAFT_1201574 [Suillus fuscotomentosus]KAG1885848.1 hypothetical protein F5891DRAFT_1201574 [Suillus fuscotomentosus]